MPHFDYLQKLTPQQWLFENSSLCNEILVISILYLWNGQKNIRCATSQKEGIRSKQQSMRYI